MYMYTASNWLQCSV